MQHLGNVLLVEPRSSLPVDGEEAQMQTGNNETPPTQDPKRKIPFDEDGWQKALAVARAGKAKGEGKGSLEQAAKRGKSEA